MRQKEKLINPGAVDPDGIAEAQTLVGAGPLALDGILVVDGVYTGDFARKIGILSAGDDSGDTFTVIGTDQDGKALTEAIAGSAGTPGTSESVGYFKTITSVSTSGASTGDVSVGTVDEISTNTIPLNVYNSEPATVSLENFSGTINATVQETFSRVQYTDNIAFSDSTLGPTAAAAAADMSRHASGVRLLINSYTTGGFLTMIVNQNECGS